MKELDLTLLTSPGNGVHTVHTAKDKKEMLWNKLYGQTKGIDEKWKNSLEQLKSEKRAAVLGIASDCGGGILRGANWGPLFLRMSFLEHMGFPEFTDLGDIRVIPHLLHDKYLNDETIKECRKALYGTEDSTNPVSPLSMAELIANQFYSSYPDSGLFSLGGDHSVSYPVVLAYVQQKKKQGKKVAVIHFDAHTDLLDQRLGIDICFGSWASPIIPELDSPELLIQLGIRSTAKERSHWEKTKGIKQYWASEVMQNDNLASEIVDHLKNHKIEELYISVDIDCLDATYAAATGTPEVGGLAPDQVVTIISTLGQEFAITGGDLVEVAPFTKAYEHINPEPDSTLISATIISNELIGQINQSCQR